MIGVGDTVGQCRLVRVIGQGGMGVVFEAVHTRIKSKRAAVKVLDFGIARINEPDDDRRKNTLTKTGSVLGTPSFGEPGGIDPAADQDFTREGRRHAARSATHARATCSHDTPVRTGAVNRCLLGG